MMLYSSHDYKTLINPLSPLL